MKSVKNQLWWQMNSQLCNQLRSQLWDQLESQLSRGGHEMR